MELNDKVALVTGSAHRLGRAIALALARAGADIAIHYSRSKADAAQLGELIRSLNRRAELLQADLRQPAEIESMFAALGETFGHLDVLVNNAAVYHRTPIDTLTAEQWDAEMAVNARAPALCMRYALPLMRGRGGAIINITDISAEKPASGYPAYCASKAALLALTKSAAKALARFNIRVNSIAPGAIAWPEGTPQKRKQRVLSQIPMKRTGRPEDIAAATVFLARQDYITGQNLRVDGGWHMG